MRSLALLLGLLAFAGPPPAHAGGSSPLLADGLDATEVPALLALGSPAAAPAALVQLRADRATVVLPPGFSAGPASVVLYAVYQDQGFASNTVSVVLP